MSIVSTRRAAATIHRHPGGATLAAASVSFDADEHAAPPVHAALSRLWADFLPGIVAAAEASDRFTFAITFHNGEGDDGCDLYVNQGLYLPALVRTVAHKLERQRATVASLQAPARFAGGTEVQELHGDGAERVLTTLAALRGTASYPTLVGGTDVPCQPRGVEA